MFRGLPKNVTGRNTRDQGSFLGHSKLLGAQQRKGSSSSFQARLGVWKVKEGGDVKGTERTPHTFFSEIVSKSLILMTRVFRQSQEDLFYKELFKLACKHLCRWAMGYQGAH